MIDFNEQQGSGDEAKAETAGAKGETAPSCGGAFGESSDFNSCGCEHGGFTSSTSTDLVYSRTSLPAPTETVFAGQGEGQSSAPASADLNAAEREALWASLVQSQQPDALSALKPASVALNPMQWTLVDLTSAGCDKPGCDPVACDSADCDTTEEYDRAEYEISEYASGREPAVTYSLDDAREYAFQDGPAPAPTAFVESESDTAQAKTPKARKQTAAKKAGKKTPKITAVEAEPAQAETPAIVKVKRTAAKKPVAKRAKAAKIAGKKVAAKTTAKKGAKKAAATKAASKRAAKKPVTARSKKAVAEKFAPPAPLNDPTFPRAQAA